MNKKILVGAIVVAGIVGVSVWMYSRGASDKAAQAKAGKDVPAVSVSTVRASQRDVPVALEAIGTVASLNTVDVKPQVSNAIAKVHIKEGQFVRAGDLLFTLDDRADRANLEKAQAQLARDEAALADLERQLTRSKELLAKGFIAQSALDTVASQVDGQRAALKADQAAIHGSDVALSYNTIRSPLSGRAGGITMFAGSLAQPTTTLVTIAQIDPIGVSFTLPEAQLQAVLGATRRGAVPVAAVVPGSTRQLQGRLEFVDNNVDTAAGTVRAKATFANPDMALWPGQYVTSRIGVDTMKGATVVPFAAIVTNTTGKVLYVVGADDVAQLRKIEVAYEFGAGAVVRGVAPGERVVVEGKQNLRPGQTVREASAPNNPALKDSADPGAPSAPAASQAPAAAPPAGSEKRP